MTRLALLIAIIALSACASAQATPAPTPTCYAECVGDSNPAVPALTPPPTPKPSPKLVCITQHLNYGDKTTCGWETP
jgi:hypothetical protein